MNDDTNTETETVPVLSVHTIQSFCDTHCACDKGRAWAKQHCRDLSEVWHTASPGHLAWVATRPMVLDSLEIKTIIISLQSKLSCAREWQIQQYNFDHPLRDPYQYIEALNRLPFLMIEITNVLPFQQTSRILPARFNFLLRLYAWLLWHANEKNEPYDLVYRSPYDQYHELRSQALIPVADIVRRRKPDFRIYPV